MSWDDYLAAVAEKHPVLAKPDARVAVRAGSIVDLLRQAHAHGVEHGQAAERGAQMLREKKATEGNDPLSAFGKIFGKN